MVDVFLDKPGEAFCRPTSVTTTKQDPCPLVIKHGNEKSFTCRLVDDFPIEPATYIFQKNEKMYVPFLGHVVIFVLYSIQGPAHPWSSLVQGGSFALTPVLCDFGAL